MTARRHSARISASPRGGFSVALPEEERALLTTLPGQLISLLEGLDSGRATVPPAIQRLFPPAYPTDARAESAYTRLVRDDLLEHHRESLILLRDTAEVTHLDEAGLEAWLAALTDLRLMLGSSLDVTEDIPDLDPNEPRYLEWICYHYLSGLQAEVVDALADLLPEPFADDDIALPEDPWGEPPGGLRWDGNPVPDAP